MRRGLGLALGAALAVAACLPAARDHAGRVARITYYQDSGLTYGGTWTTPGVTVACSWNIPLWSSVWIDGDGPYTCEDRGALGWADWIDVYGGPWVAARYGDWADIEVGQ